MISGKLRKTQANLSKTVGAVRNWRPGGVAIVDRDGEHQQHDYERDNY